MRLVAYKIISVSRAYLSSETQADMGMTYDELCVFGRLRKVEKCGPYSMYTKLVQEWGDHYSPIQVRSQNARER